MFMGHVARRENKAIKIASTCYLFHIFSRFYLIFEKKEMQLLNTQYSKTAKIEVKLISKGLFGVIVSTKKPTDFLKDFCPSLKKEFKSKNFIT